MKTKINLLSKEHEERYEDLVARANIKGDIKREIEMYIIAGGSSLYTKADRLYYFKKNRFIFYFKENEDGKEEIGWKASLSS